MNLRTTICKTFLCAGILHAYFLLLPAVAICQDKPLVRGVGEETAVSKTIGNQYALVVGVSKYHNIPALLYADDDAVSFKNFLTDTKLVPEANIHILIDSTATRSRFYAEIKKIMDKLKENDRVIIYFAGHGDVDNDIDAGFLLGYNCEATPYAASDAIDISMLERYVDAITKKNVKVILISDACRSGKLTGGAHGAELTLTALSSRFKNTVKILSCGPGELSEETNFRDGGHGIFTYYLLQALYGMADEDNNNIITKKELDKFLRDKVSKATNDRQNPIIEGNANEAILDVIPELKQAMIAKAQNAANGNNMIAHRSFEERKMNGISLEDSMLVKKFYIQIRDGKLNAPQGDNAYETYLSARKTIANRDIVNSMKYDLAAGLEDDVQPLLNRFTRGEFQDYPYDLFDAANKKLDIIKSDLIDPDDYRYNDIKALQIFFNRAGYYNKQSLADLLKADSILPNTAYIKLEIGRCYAEQVVPDTSNAFKYFNNAIRIAPTWPFPHLIAGLLYMDLGYWDKAKASYLKSLEIKSDFKLALINIGVLYSRLKDYDNEIMYYRKAMEIPKPENVVLLGNIALHYKVKEMYDSAIYYYRMGYVVSPWNIYNLSGMIRTFSKLKQRDSVLYYTEKIKTLSPVTDDDYKDIGDIYLDLPDYQNAIKYYSDGLSIKGTPFLYNNLGLAYERSHDYNRAIRNYKMAVTLQPDYTTSLNNLALLYDKSNMYDSAIYYYRREFSIDPKDIYTLTAIIQEFNKLKQKDSVTYYAKFFDNPKFNNLVDLKKIGYMYLEIDAQKSLDYYNKALALKQEAETYNNMGLAWEYLSNINEAKRYYKQAIRLNPDYALSQFNLGLLSYKAEKYDSAIYYYRKAYLIDPSDSSTALSISQSFIKLKQKDSTLNYLKKLEGYDFGANDLRRIGDVYLDLSIYNDAARYYRKSIASKPTVEAYNNLGLVYERTQDIENAKKYYKLVLPLDPNYTTTLNNLAALYYNNAEYDSAIVYYKRLLPLLESTAVTYNMIGASYLNSLKYDTAIVYYKKAIEKNPSDANSYVNIGHSYYLNNQYTEAVPYYEQALKLDQSYTLPIPRLAYGYLLLKRYDEAINLYQKAIKQDTTMASQSVYYYNMACATSLQKKTADALSYFDKSLKTGYLDLKHFEEDTDIDNIRTLPGFRKLIEEHFSKEEIDKHPKLFAGK